jgi:hypothetical protein
VGEFFRLRQRKIGAVTLALALLFAGTWMRSLTDQDALFRLSKNDTNSVISMDERIAWTRCWPIVKPGTSRWLFRHDKNPGYEEFNEGFDVRRNFSGFGFVFCAICKKEAFPGMAPYTLELEIWQIPDWSLAIPFASLSASVLLSKRRAAKPLV